MILKESRIASFKNAVEEARRLLKRMNPAAYDLPGVPNSDHHGASNHHQCRLHRLIALARKSVEGQRAKAKNQSDNDHFRKQSLEERIAAVAFEAYSTAVPHQRCRPDCRGDRQATFDRDDGSSSRRNSLAPTN